MDVDKVFLMIPEFKEVKHYKMKAAWNDFYAENPNVSVDVSEAESIKDKFDKWWAKQDKSKYYVKSTIEKKKYVLNSENPELSAQNLTRAQRNNLLIDIAFGILIHKSTADKILNPGNFNTLKLMSRVASITETPEMLEQFAEQFNCKNGEEVDKEAVTRKLMNYINTKNLDVLDKFVKDHPIVRNPLSPLTFAYYHQQNMVGAALIGMYANNTTAQAKFQQADGFSINPEFDFIINGRQISSLNKAYEEINGVQERISKMCAQWSAASVDNVKDPVLAMLMQNTKTANIAGTLIRAGVSIEEVSMLFRQPVIVKLITETGELSSRNIGSFIKAINDRIAKYNEENFTNIPFVGADSSVKEFKTDGISSETLLKNMVKGEDIYITDDIDFLRDQAKILNFFKWLILPIADDMSELTKISRADSPNAAIDTSLSGAKIQIARVNRFNSRKQNDDKFALKGLDRVLDTKVNSKMSIDELRDAFFTSKMPMLQAFYSLGIELPIGLIDEEYMPQMGENISSIVNTIMIDTSDYWTFGPKDNVKDIYRDITTFALSKTKLFGDDGTNTFWDKYTYYMYEYPKHFLEAIRSNEEVSSLPAIAKMEVKDGVIILNRAGRLDRTVREIYSRSLDSLLYMDGEISMTINGEKKTYPIQKLAVDLFMYAFYAENLGFGPHNFSMFLSSQYATAFPEYIETLRTINKMMESSELRSNFIEQFWANRGKKAAVRIDDESEDKSEILESDDGTIDVLPSKIINRMKNNKEPYSYIVYNYKLYRLKSLGSSYHNYEVVPTINNERAFYNANQTALELSESKIDPKLIEELRSISAKDSQEGNTQDALESISFPDVSSLSSGLLETINPNEIPSMEDLRNAQAEYNEQQNGFGDFQQWEDMKNELDSLNNGSNNLYNIKDGQSQLEKPLC